MLLNRFASLDHYADHLDPIWSALPEEARGASWAPRTGRPGVTVPRPSRGGETSREAVLVASWPDAVSSVARGRPLVYVEHGAGQAYGGDPTMAHAPGWSGARDATLDRVKLFVCPSETVAARWSDRYQAPAVAVGCPKLDRLHLAGPRPPGRVVAVTFHWDCQLGPETRSAWSVYDRSLPELAAWAKREGVQLLGHGHPRIWSRIRRRWQSLGVEPVQYLADVLDRADVLVGDNTSALYEFASLDRPVVVLNAPWYRRDVEHGLRFWSHVPGRQVDDRSGLVAAVAAAVADPASDADLRRRAVAAAYHATDGRAAARAATAILEALA